MKSKILIIDDQEDILTLLNDYFENFDYEIHVSDSATKAIALFKNHKFDVVLTDILMPDKDGLELILELRDLSEEDPLFIAMSGEPVENEKLDFLQAAELFGADYTITKPFELESLRRLIEDFFDENTGEEVDDMNNDSVDSQDKYSLGQN